ncbi:MAG: tetratricopeptide repeat protein [Candidatus Thorarchaeota archaeon]
MEPLGTITKYYPFIDDETKSNLGTLMKESSSYFDFIQRLSNTVLENESPDNLVYIAAAHCWYAGDIKSAILDKYNSLATIAPWRYYWGTHESWKFENCQVILHSLDSALESSKENWIATELLLAQAYNLGIRPEGVKLLSKANAILDRYPDFLCFKPLSYIAEGNINFWEGKISDAITQCRKGCELARANVDVVYEFLSMLDLGYYIRNKRPQESLDQFEQTYQIAQNLGVPVFTGETLCGVGLAYEILGEYDLAISSQLGCLDEVPPTSNEILFAILSRLYAILGDGQRSLEWADRSLDDKEFHIGYLRKARALIILNRLDEAETYLNIASRKVFQAGYEDHLALYHFVSGLYDMAKGEFANAMGTLEQAYEIIYPMERLTYLNEILITLASVELALLSQSLGSDGVMTGKWLSTLENHARTFEMPGVVMQASLLRSEAFKSQGQLQDARETLQRALELSDSPGVKTLRKRIKDHIQEIERLIHDEGMVS